MQSDKIAEMIYELQKKHGYSNYQICKRAGINRTVYDNAMCSGNPKIEVLQAILSVYSLSIQDFFDILEGKNHALRQKEALERTNRELEAIEAKISFIRAELKRTI